MSIVPTEDRYAAFRHPSFARYFTARFSTAFATQIISVAVGWQIYDETQNAALLGWIGLVQFLPALLLVIITGMASDRLGRRFVMGTSILFEMGCALTILYLALSGQFKPVFVLLTLTIFGVARAFHTPASSSLVVNIVPKKDFTNAVGWSTSSWRISGPFAYGVAATIYAFAAFCIFSIAKPAQKIANIATSFETLTEGFRYIWKEKIILGAISLDLFAVLLAGAVALLPIYARDILEVGEVGLGFLRAAPGIGAIVMIILLTSFPIKNHAGVILFVSVALCAGVLML